MKEKENAAHEGTPIVKRDPEKLKINVDYEILASRGSGWAPGSVLIRMLVGEDAGKLFTVGVGSEINTREEYAGTIESFKGYSHL